MSLIAAEHSRTPRRSRAF